MFCLSCFVKILTNYKKYFEEIFGNLQKMIEERMIADFAGKSCENFKKLAIKKN